MTPRKIAGFILGIIACSVTLSTLNAGVPADIARERVIVILAVRWLLVVATWALAAWAFGAFTKSNRP